MMSDEPDPKNQTVKIIILSWLSMIGFDFFLHGGLMAGFYTEPDSFLLPPDRAFRLIPLGYLSFLVLACLLVWLMHRLSIQGGKNGFLFGVKLGALVWGALALGLLSITTADPWLLAGWFFGQTAELGIAGAFAGIAFTKTKLNRLFALVFGLIVVSVLITIMLQSAGVVPTITIQ